MSEEYKELVKVLQREPYVDLPYCIIARCAIIALVAERDDLTNTLVKVLLQRDVHARCADAAEAKARRYEITLRGIAKQKIPPELDWHELQSADYETGYICIVKDARKALAAGSNNGGGDAL